MNETDFSSLRGGEWAGLLAKQPQLEERRRSAVAGTVTALVQADEQWPLENHPK